jgi:ketosteroid isomerase-like protein
MSEENAEVVRNGIDALNRGDWDGWVASLSPDVVWESLSGVPGLEDAYRGRGAVREWIEELNEVAVGLHIEIERITALSDDKLLIALTRTARGRASGLPTDHQDWSILWFAEGQITRRQAFWTKEEALEAAGLPE